MMEEKDEVLVGNLKTGDIKAYEALYEKYRGRLYHFAFGYLKSHVEAEGLVQDVFVKIWKRKPTSSRNAPLSPTSLP
ncbi:RNA polymerase sigma factor [Zobellia nedashkovskayae]